MTNSQDEQEENENLTEQERLARLRGLAKGMDRKKLICTAGMSLNELCGSPKPPTK